MGVIPTGKSPTIGHLWPHHRSMARTLVSGGARPKDLAALYGITPSQVTKITNSPLFLAEVSRLELGAENEMSDIAQDMKRLSQKAVEIIDEDMHSSDTDKHLRNQTAFGVLKLTANKVAASNLHLHQHIHEKVENMDESDLYKDVLDLIEDTGEV